MRNVRFFALTAVVGLLLAGCAAPGSKPHSWDSTYDYGTPGPVISAHGDVKYYPACGNEVLTFEGRTWFQFKPMHPDAMPHDPLASAPVSTGDAGDAASPTPSALGLVGGAGGRGVLGMAVHRVVAPGPGDDVGTLVIYENDLAYWQSNTGGLSRWLTNHEIEYNWVC